MTEEARDSYVASNTKAEELKSFFASVQVFTSISRWQIWNTPYKYPECPRVSLLVLRGVVGYQCGLRKLTMNLSQLRLVPDVKTDGYLPNQTRPMTSLCT